MKVGDLVEAYGKAIGIVVQVSGSTYAHGIDYYLIYYPDGTCDWECEPWIEPLPEK